MKRVFFKQGEKVFKYTVFDYEIRGDFYEFTDVFDGMTRKLHKEFYRGEEQLTQEESERICSQKE